MISQPMAQDTDNKEQKLYNNNVEVVASGLVTDVSEINQPDGTQRYVLNGIHETVNKNINTLSNDYSNKALDLSKVPLNTETKDIILGSVYVNNDEYVLFVLSYRQPTQEEIDNDEVPLQGVFQSSKLFLFNSVTKRLDFLISDENTENDEDKLHFNEHHQIQAIYRLRRGCDRTIYFTDNFNVPRTINIDKLYNYYSVDETYAISDKFNLIKTYNQIPVFEGIEVKEGGKLLPGGYNLTIRLLDDDLNPTDWITTTDVIVVSNFDGDSQYTKMRGSTAKETDWQKFGETTKLIKASVKSDSIDTNFKFLQFGLIYANSGDGTVGGVNVSPMIGIEESNNAPDYYTYQFTGAVEYDKDTAESVSFGPTNVGKAKTITSTQNRLLLGNVESKQVDWCRLQKYASKIASSCIVRTKRPSYTADPTSNFNDIGYMPGEIYSFGIVYVFDDGTTSPAYHIPGGTEPVIDLEHDEVDLHGRSKQRPMNFANRCTDVKYTDRSGCDNFDFWGKDYLGNDLNGQNVRHHRFPTRTEIGTPLFSINHAYSCNKRDCESGDFQNPDYRVYCKNTYYIKIPYHKITNHYRRNHSSFDIDIYLGIYDENGTYTYTDNDNNISYKYNIERISKTIDIDDWKASYIYSDRNKYYCLELGIFDYLPRILGISEQPVLYTRSDGDSGIRYGWETTAGYMKIRYTSVNNWVEAKSSEYPLTEDGDNLDKVFQDVMIRPSSSSGENNRNIRGIWKRNKDRIRFLYDKNNILTGFATYLSTNNIEYYNLSVTNIVNYPEDGIKPIVIPNRDVNLDDCREKYPSVLTNTILGIHFWNIEIPSLKDTNNNKIIGYYIVRNKRDDDNKTILDSAITIPLSQKYTKTGGNVSWGEYITYGFNSLSYVQGTREKNNEANNSAECSRDAIGFINPEFKYLKKKYKNFSFIKEGEFVPQNINNFFNFTCDYNDPNSIVSTCSYPNAEVNPFDTDMIIEDVQAGSSYNKKENKKDEEDNDGFELYSLVRERIYSYYRKTNSNYIPSKVKYLDALDDTIMEAENGGLRVIHNLSSDNAIGIMEFGDGSQIQGDSDTFFSTMSYGYLKMNIPNPYGNFRQLPYYKESKELIPLYYSGESDNLSYTTVFSGDVYTTPMKYWNSIFYNTRIRLRRRKPYIWRIVVGAVSTAASIVGTAFATIFTGGAMLSTGIATVKASFSLMMSGIKLGKINQLYTKLYFKGLQSTLEDVWTKYFLKRNNPLDDQIQWVFEVSNSLWFESTINQFWRVGTSGDLPDFLEPLKIYDTQDYATYITNKMTIADSERNNGRVYQGFASAEYYEVNPDYMRGNTQKAFYHLPIQYDCCSKCLERFPHRVMYSEVSFQEELTDNYTKFLALNYRDIPGETGEITNIFSVGSFLYIHTEEGLWNLPVGYQKLETAGLTTYLGNGQFFSTDPQKVGDLGFGNKYQHGFLMSKYGVFFVDEQYGRIYFMEKGKSSYGKETLGSPVSISDSGLTYWSKDNVKSFIDEYYRRTFNTNYPHLDNTSVEEGMGYLSVYDERNERFIITKKDIIVKPKSNGAEKPYLVFNGEYYNTDISAPDDDPRWEFIGFEDNLAVWGRQRGGATGTVPGIDSITEYSEGVQSLQDKILKIRFIDENSNELTSEQMSQFNIILPSSVDIKYIINDGNEETASNSDLSYGFAVFNSTEVPIDSTITITNIQTILDTIFQNSNQSYTNDSVVTSIEGVDEQCYSIITITVTTSVSTSQDCSLTLIKQFNNVNSQERLEELFALFKEEPEPTPEPEEVEIEGINGDSTMVIIDGAEIAPQEDIYYRDVNTGKLYLFDIDTGVLVEVEEPEPEPQESGPEISFTWADGLGNVQTKTYSVKIQNYYLDSDGSGVFVFETINVDCNDVDWVQIKNEIPSHVDESGLFKETPTFHIDNTSTLTGNNEKTLTLVNVEDNDAKSSPIEDVKKEIVTEKSLLREGEFHCIPESEYDQVIDENAITYEIWQYEVVKVPLEKLTVNESDIEDHSWTLSWNMKTQSWESFHSYLPNFYLGAKDTFYSYRVDEEGLWQHNIEGDFGKYYNSIYDFVLDYVSVANNGIQTKVFNDVQVIADVKTYDANVGDYYDNNVRFFDKVIFSNSRQCSNEKDLIVKDAELLDENYLLSQVQGRNEIIVDRNERNWSLNNIRDIVNKAANTPIWIKQYGNTDKVLNPNVFLYPLGQEPSWFDTNEIFRDKFLEIRFIFSNFVTVNEGTEEEPIYVNKNNDKITVYFLLNQENISVR